MAGVPVEQLQARGHFRLFFTMVDLIAPAAARRWRKPCSASPAWKSQGSSPVQPSIVGPKFLWRAA